MTRILLIRHGQTEWNRERIFRGRADVPLSAEGLRQAQALAERLATDDVAAVYTSPLVRAVATAEHAAKPHCSQPITVDALTDMSYGEWEGKPHERVQEQWPDLYEKWHSAPHLVRPPGGETLSEVRQRALEALLHITAEKSDATVVVVSHRVVCKLLLCAALGLEDSAFWHVRQDTCCVNLLEYEHGRMTVCLLNDTCHLRGLERDTFDF
jgi:broad specificity phosphatase PhoE